MDYFWSPNKAYGKERKRKEKKRKKGGGGGGGGGRGNQAKVWILVWIHHFGMIFVHELLGYDC